MTSPAASRFVFVDALRGVAACWVLVCHFYNELSAGGSRRLLPWPLHDLSMHGHLGVQIFFVLSGFVIAHSVGNARVTPGYVGRFALRRSLRLDPPYWVAIFGYYLSRRMLQGPLTDAQSPFNEWQNVLVNMFYLDNVLGARSIVAVGWTLCLEVQLYLAFVLLVGVMGVLERGPIGKWARALVFVPIAIYSLALASGLTSFDRQKYFFLPYWYMFFLGAMVSWAISSRVKWRWTIAWLVAVLASLLVEYHVETLVAAGVASALAIAGKAGRLGTMLRWRWIQYLGVISYSLYLLHPLCGSRIIRLIMKRFDEQPSALVCLLLFLVGLATALLASHLMYRFVERPSMALSKRIALRRDEHLAGAHANPVVSEGL